VAEEDVRQRLEAVREPMADVDGDRVPVADVLRGRLARLRVEHDDASRPGQAHEEVVLPPFVEVEPSDDAAAREREVRLARALGEPALAVELHEPPALVLEPAKRDPRDAVDHGRFAPWRRTKSLTA